MKTKHRRTVGEHLLVDKLNDVRFRNFDLIPFDDDHAILTEYNGNASHVIVPAVLKKYYIEELGPRLFSNNPTVTRIVIQEGVEVIHDGTFEDCINLEKIVIPASISEINGQPFAGCQKLKKIIISPENTSLEIIYGMLIEKNSGRLVFCLNRSVVSAHIPEGVRIISPYAFMYCKKLCSISFPKSLEYIEDGAFECTGLADIKIPSEYVYHDPLYLDLKNFLSEAKVVPGSEAEKLCIRTGLIKRSDVPDDNGYVEYSQNNTNYSEEQ